MVVRNCILVASCFILTYFIRAIKALKSGNLEKEVLIGASCNMVTELLKNMNKLTSSSFIYSLRYKKIRALVFCDLLYVFVISIMICLLMVEIFILH